MDPLNVNPIEGIDHLEGTAKIREDDASVTVVTYSNEVAVDAGTKKGIPNKEPNEEGILIFSGSSKSI